MIHIIGGGPSGLVAANVCAMLARPFRLYAAGGENGFSSSWASGVEYKSGQRTLFCSCDMDRFFADLDMEPIKLSLSDLTGVHYRGKVYRYPVQNNLPFKEKLAAWVSYMMRDRRKAGASKFGPWVVGNFGEYISSNIILPHTWKTIKEDLWEIESGSFGQKVIPMKLWSKGVQSSVYEYANAPELLKALRENIKDSITPYAVKRVNLNPARYLEIEGAVDMENPYERIKRVPLEKGDVVLNTIALPKLMPLVQGASEQDVLDVATRSLHYNNMFLGVMILPTKFILIPHKIIYFPEREYIFSKVNINRSNGYTAVAAEVSFRKNDESLFSSPAYCRKIMDRIEGDLKKSGIILQNTFASYHTSHKIISPAYIICDSDYSMYNDTLQTWLKHQGIHNVGRFAEWLPHKRVEHSLIRTQEILNDL